MQLILSLPQLFHVCVKNDEKNWNMTKESACRALTIAKLPMCLVRSLIVMIIVITLKNKALSLHYSAGVSLLVLVLLFQ